ncbi:MAG: SH3 domain-containing protein [Lachnospiraceae bacterium]|nr:SH3 domain-containing protein [Lachnospiraceae bacterium]
MSEKKQNQSKNGNGKKNQSATNQFADRLREDKTFAAIVGGSILAVIVIIVLIYVFAGKKKDETDEGGTLSDNGVSVNTVSDAAVSTADGQVVASNINEAVNPMDIVNNLVDTYFASLASGDTDTIKAIKNHSEEEELLKIEKRSAYIESFENVNVYTKPGPVDNSYIAFVYYEIKFKELNTAAPGLITLYMSAGEDGNLYIYDGQLDEQLDESVVDYIKELAVTEEIVALFDKVKVKYNEALDQDQELKTFMDGLSDRLEAEVNAELAQRKEQTEGTSEENTEQPAESTNQVSETVVATDTVNVRSSDSENADKLGKLEIGTKVTRYEAKENGWSRIDYNGQEAYVKSEYLKVDDGSVVEQPSQEQTASTSSDSSSSGEKVTVKETVKVRKSANTDGEVLATAYPGEKFELVMKQADGWTKIKYNGQTAYIKSEYLE